MEKICGIYKITSPSGKIYIGQSINIYKRWKGHKESINCNINKSKLKSSFLKYGYNNHSFVVLQECLPNQLNELEKYYVDLFQTFNSEHGLNLRDGGGSKGNISPETINKMKRSKIGNKYCLGYKHTSIARKNMSDSHKGYKWTEEQRIKIIKSNIGKHTYWKGKKMSDKTKEKMRLAAKGKKKSKEHAENIRKSWIIRKQKKQNV